MIGTGCGIATDHFARSGVIANGARAMWGIPASLATSETALVGGVVDEPMMMSALDSVTKRRALVVAAVGSPPSSSTITFSGTPAISFATKSSALRSGMPSAAAGPVVVMVMPMVISLVCAVAGDPAVARAPASATADKKVFLIHSSLVMLVSIQFDRLFPSSLRRCGCPTSARKSTLHELRNNLLRHRCRFQPRGVVGMTPDQNAGLERLDRQRLALEHLVDDLKARALETFDPAFDGDPVAMGRGDIEFRSRVDHGNADQAVFLDDILLGEAGSLEQDRSRIVEHREIARVVDDVGGVAIAPLDLHIAPMDEHAVFLARRHAQRSIEPHPSAAQAHIVDHVQRQRGQFVRLAEPPGEG